MNAVTRKIVLLLSLAAFSMNAACTTIKPIDVDEQTTYAQQIKVGDKVRLLYLDERVKEIRVTEVNEQEISGKLDSGGVVIADWRDIYEAEQVKISPVKTAGAAVGVVIAIPVLAVLAIMSGCVSTYC
ncbi:MAG: hypothetical protein GY783_15105 [Gammaproteobacteria bacterium]|nr:hypothetical protein [Gammaproteobacteria bacterium]